MRRDEVPALTELGVIAIGHQSQVVGGRDRILRVALQLGVSEERATRLATLVSQVGRALAGTSRHEIAVRWGAGHGGEGELSLQFCVPTGSRSRAAGLAALVDDLDVVADGDGFARVVASVAVPGGAAERADVDELRAVLRQRSRAELMDEIRAKNEELTRHGEQLEETVAQRTSELRRAMATAEEANRAKGDFLSNMSHELRTPLNGVLGYAQLLLRDRDVKPGQRKPLEGIQSCGRHLLQLINDVLDLSKIESGRMELRAEPTDLLQLLQEVGHIVRPKAEEKGLEFAVDLAPELPATMHLDGPKFRQILVNLLGNAIKFTDTGRVTLAARTAEPWLRIAVGDTGPGIPEAKLESIFDPFQQDEAGHTHGGTGLGLSISRNLVEAMGGELTVDSVVGEGSTFCLALPLGAAEPTVVMAAATVTERPEAVTGVAEEVVVEPGQDVQVLVVDDIADNRTVLAELLRQLGVASQQATNGLEAVQALAAGSFAACLMDLRMPVMDGVSAAKKLRGDPELRTMPLIAVTASVLDTSAPDVLAAGFDGFLGKPFEVGELVQVLRQHVPEIRFVPAEANAPSPEPAKGGGRGTDLDPVALGEVCSQLRDLAELGDVAGLSALAESLAADPASSGLGEEIGTLARQFDFDALLELADSLEAGKGG